MGSSSDSNISGDKTEDSRGGPDFWLTMIQMPFGMYTGTDQQEESISLRLYPNPVSENRLFFVTGGEQISAIELFSLTGVKVFSRNNICESSTGIEVEHLLPGMYIGAVMMRNGSIMKLKFIKQ